MALQKCKECGNEISTSATMCPKCGAKIKRTSTVTKIAAVVFIPAVVIAVASGSHSNSTPAAPKTPAELASDNAKELRFQKTLLLAKTLKGAMKNPDSFVIDQALANDDASVICVTYKAQNSFGATIQEEAAYAKGKISQDSSFWNKYCANKSMNDISYVRQALK